MTVSVWVCKRISLAHSVCVQGEDALAMQLPNLGVLSLHHAASAPVPDHELAISTYTANDVVDIDGDDSQPEEDLEDEEAALAALSASSRAEVVPKHIRDLQRDLAALDQQAAPKNAGKQPAAKGGPSADAMRARQARQAAEEGGPSRRREKQPKSAAELEEARLKRNQKARERNAAKSVEGVVEKLIKQVEAQNAPTENPEVIDLTTDVAPAPPPEEKKKKKKHKTWWMINNEDSRTPGERHASNEGSYNRLEFREGSKGDTV